MTFTIDFRSVIVSVQFSMKTLVAQLFQHKWQVVKYGVAGVSGGAIQVLLLYVFVDIFGFWYLYGVVLAFLIALVVVFLLQKFWTFQDRELRRVPRQSMLYTIVALGSLLLNVLCMFILVDIFNAWYILAQSITVLGVGVLSFLVNKHVTFSSQHYTV